LLVAILYGKVMNIVKFAQQDFEAPYKTEIIRGIGIPVVPMGIVLGYIDLEGDPK
jgi:hypothetical protein